MKKEVSKLEYIEQVGEYIDNTHMYEDLLHKTVEEIDFKEVIENSSALRSIADFYKAYMDEKEISNSSYPKLEDIYC